MDNGGDVRGITMLVAMVVLVHNFTCLFVKGDICGKPGLPLGGNYNPTKYGYNASEEVFYSCDLRNGYLFGNTRRSCLLNGSWSGFIPTCDTNLAFEKIVSGTEQSCLKKSLVDNNRNTFCNIYSGQPVVIDFGLESDISYVLLNLYPHYFYSFNVDGTDIRNVKRQCKALQNTYIDETDFKVVCNNGTSLRGNKLTVTFYSNAPVYEIGAYSNGVNSCGEPDIPTHGIWSKTGYNTEGKFSCEQSYFLQGDPFTWCVNGQWNTTGQSCHRAPVGWQGCGEPGFPLKGDRYVEGKLQNESNYFCTEGFTLVGNKMRKCGFNSTNWSSTIPTCVTNVAFKKSASHQPGTFKPALSTDENSNTCESQAGKFYGYIDLLKETNFNNINLTIKTTTGWLVNITVYVTNNTNIKSITFKDTSTLKGVCSVNNVYPATPIQCNHPEFARYIVMYFSQSVSVCEVIAFNSKEVMGCGQPDQPLHGRILSRSAVLTTYTCESGFKMNGSDSTRCVNGIWNSKPPFCFPMTLFTSTSTRRPITYSTRSPTTSYIITTHSHDVTGGDGSRSEASGTMGIAWGATTTCLLIVLILILVYRGVRKHYKNRNRDRDSRGCSPSDSYYTATYQIAAGRNGGELNEVPTHMYETIKEPETSEEPDYLVPLRPANAVDRQRC